MNAPIRLRREFEVRVHSNLSNPKSISWKRLTRRIDHVIAESNLNLPSGRSKEFKEFI